LLSIHQLRDRSDLSKTRLREVSSRLHHAQDGNEPFEVELLGSSQWTLFEDRHHTIDEVASTLHGEAQERLAVIVVALVLDNAAAIEDSDEEFECRPAARGLGDRELVLDLPAESEPCVTNNRYREATFAIYEADSPLLDTWPFLLIDRTGRIFTAHVRTLRRG